MSLKKEKKKNITKLNTLLNAHYQLIFLSQMRSNLILQLTKECLWQLYKEMQIFVKCQNKSTNKF